MKGFITQFAAGSLLSAGVFVVAGCSHYRDVVDPCWPDRYDKIARDSVHEMTNAQADKGHLLDQTVWNWHFEKDKADGPTANLSGAGIAALQIISRRTP